MKNVAFGVLGALVLASTTINAHHGYGGFFDPKERTVAVEGDLVGLVWQPARRHENPGGEFQRLHGHVAGGQLGRAPSPCHEVNVPCG